MHGSRKRNRKGAMIIFMCFFIGMVILPTLALFSFEVVRATVIRDQLRSICQAAALAGAARLASSDNRDPVITHNDVINAAIETYRANALNEFALVTAAKVGNAQDNPTSNQSSVFVELLNPNSSPPNQPVTIGDTNGRVIHVVGAFGLAPVFGKFIGIPGPYTIRVDGHSRVPQLDLVLCFDVSGSIDDQTPVTMVKRYWDNVSKRVRYQITQARSGAGTTGGLAQGRMFDIVGPVPTGTTLNAIYPQNLDVASLSSLHSRPLTFSSSLRGSSNSGSPPGNYPNGGSLGDNFTFTDMVVNIGENPADSTMQLPYTSPAGFRYPSLEAVVEAARGNLDNATAFSNAKLNTVSSLSTILPTPGYQADYFANARKKVRPLGDAQLAAQDFFTIMNTNTEANFGFVSFTTNAGRSATETQTEYNVAGNYSQAGSGAFPRPAVKLVQTDTNYDEILSVVPKTVALESTNIGDALLQAKDMLVTGKRPGARRAIILFTDGQPTAPGTGTTPWSYARSAASQIKTEGIPIYCVGLAQNSQVVPGECDILNDDPSKPVSYTDTQGVPRTYTPGGANPGVSYIAGNGGKFFLVTNSAHLRLTFENIARHLVAIVAPD